MPKNILILQGHPDPRPERFCHALAGAYAEGARAAGHSVRLVEIGRLDFPLLRSKDDFEEGGVPDALRPAQEAIAWAEHLVFIYPLWLGDMPAMLKAFLEQTLRPGFAVGRAHEGMRSGRLLTGRSARIVVTMGMPAFIYRWVFGAHSVKSFERNVLRFCGISPVRASLVGMVEGRAQQRAKWLARLHGLGRKGA